jgi:hypothetical protein
MLLRLSLLTSFAALAVAPAFPDIVDNITVNGAVSGSGSIDEPCILGTPGCVSEPSGPPLVTIPLSFNGTNTALGMFSDSGSTAAGPPSLTATVGENTAEAANALGFPAALFITLSGGYSINGGASAYSASETDNISISFQLEDPSEVELMSGDFLGSAINGGELMDSHGDVLLTVPVEGNASTVLPPGTYELEASATGSSMGVFASNTSATNLTLNLTAGFTPVPEPRWTVLGVLFAGILVGFAVPRRFRTS